jgi:hypothetical protein
MRTILSAAGDVHSAPAETIIHGGRIATLDRARPFVSALAIARGRVLAIGDLDRLAAHRTDTTVMIDVQGRTVIPGLNSARRPRLDQRSRRHRKLPELVSHPLVHSADGRIAGPGRGVTGALERATTGRSDKRT